MNNLYKRLRNALVCGVISFSGGAQIAVALEDVLDTPSVATEIAHESLLLDVELAGKRLVSVGARGHIIYSDDEGKSWVQASVPVSVLLTAVDFVDARQGWAVGHGGVILHSTDAGETWVKQFDGNQANQMIIKQAEGVVAKLEDRLAGAKESEIEDLEFALEEAQYGVEDAQLDAEVGASKPLLDVLFLDENEGFAVGAYGFLFKTEDGGKSWTNYGTRMDNPDRFHLNAIAQVNGGALIVGGEAGMLFRSEDNGDSWEAIDSPYEGSFFGITAAAADKVVLAHGLRGNLFRSEDAGISWDALDSATESTLMGGAVGPNGDITIVGNSGSVIYSSDGGETFKEYIRPNRLGNTAVIFLKRKQLVVVGENGVSLTDNMGQNLK